MTYYELKNRFYFEFVDSCGVLCATPVELYNAVNSIAAKKPDKEIDWIELKEYLAEAHIDHCMFDVISCLPTAAERREAERILQQAQ